MNENYKKAVNANTFGAGLFAGMVLADVASRILFDVRLFTGGELVISGIAIAAHGWCLLSLFRLPGAKG